MIKTIVLVFLANAIIVCGKSIESNPNDPSTTPQTESPVENAPIEKSRSYLTEIRHHALRAPVEGL